jgi:PhzF family phenazine biosynthesis protein
VTTYRFKQVDVFTRERFLGNPVAVVLGADDIDPGRMQRIAAWTNLSETTFVLRPSSPEADYLLRIFTPHRELPFAGHPTVGSAHAVLEGGLVDITTTSLKQECGAGILPLTVEGSGPERRIFVRAPEAKLVREHAGAVDALAGALGAAVASRPAPMAIDVGPVWLVAYLDNAESVGRLRPDMAAIERLSHEANVIGVTVFSLDPERDPPVRLRAFAPAAGIPEDPVCGSCNVALAAYLWRTGLLAQVGEDYVASQGRELGRDGRVYVRVRDEGRQIEIGGHAMTTVDGEIGV